MSPLELKEASCNFELPTLSFNLIYVTACYPVRTGMCHSMMELLQHFMPYLHQMGQPYVYYEKVNLSSASYDFSRLASRILTFLRSFLTNNMVQDQKGSSPFRVKVFASMIKSILECT